MGRVIVTVTEDKSSRGTYKINHKVGNAMKNTRYASSAGEAAAVCVEIAMNYESHVVLGCECVLSHIPAGL